jgi:hypothetical protein
LKAKEQGLLGIALGKIVVTFVFRGKLLVNTGYPTGAFFKHRFFGAFNSHRLHRAVPALSQLAIRANLGVLCIRLM